MLIPDLESRFQAVAVPRSTSPQDPAFLPCPFLIQFVGPLRNAALMSLSTPCGLFSGACILTARTGERRGAWHSRRGATDGGFLAHRFPPHAAVFIVVDSASVSASVDTTVVE